MGIFKQLSDQAIVASRLADLKSVSIVRFDYARTGEIVLSILSKPAGQPIVQHFHIPVGVNLTPHDVTEILSQPIEAPYDRTDPPPIDAHQAAG